MRLEIVEAFAAATVRVLTLTLGEACGCGALRLTGAEERHEGVTVHVCFSGEIGGYAVLNIDRPAALKLFGLVTGEPCDDLTDLAYDYFLELGNLITGGAVSTLNELGVCVEVHSPELSLSAGAKSTPAAESCQIPVYSPYGTLLVQVVQRTW
ncbi:MAG: chemotaxis protein CheX [Candidatus Methylomirabilia bacterium]